MLGQGILGASCPSCVQIPQLSKNHPLNTCRAIRRKYVIVRMSVNMEGIQFLLVLGPGNSFAIFFPEVVVLCVSGSRDPLGGSKPSAAPCPMTACQGPPSELGRVQKPRNWILQMGKLSHHQGADVPATTHPAPGVSTSSPRHWAPKAAIKPLTVCPEPSLSCSITGLSPERGP